MKNKDKKRAIALVSLVVVIVILAMLGGIITYVSNDMIYQSKKVTYAKDIATINDAVEEYYVVNGSIPALEGGIELSSEEYKNEIQVLKGNDFLEELSLEISLNNDEEAIFYELDISKIGIDETKLGLKKDANDFYVVSNINNTVYYYPGYKIKSEIYFSDVEIINKND